MMPQGHQTLRLVSSDVVKPDCQVTAQSDDESYSALALVAHVRIYVAPLEVLHGSCMVVQTQNVSARLRRPYENLEVVGC